MSDWLHYFSGLRSFNGNPLTMLMLQVDDTLMTDRGIVRVFTFYKLSFIRGMKKLMN